MIITNVNNLYSTALTKPTVYTVSNDWRKRYVQVANFSNFNAASKETSIKLTQQEVTGIINKKQKTLKKWKPKNRTKKISVFNSQLKTSLYQFFPKEGVMAIPFEITFYNTKNKIENKISQNYKQFMDWNLQLQPSEYKDYFKMKEEILNQLDDSDYEDILLCFYEDSWFGTKKLKSYIWYDVRTINIKNIAMSDGNVPVIIMTGFMYFWGDLFLEEHLRKSLIEYNKYLGIREFIIRPEKMIPIFLRYSSGSTFQDWMKERILKYFKEGSNPIDEIFKVQLGLRDWRGINIHVSNEGMKDIKIVFSGVYRGGNEIIPIKSMKIR